MGTEILVSPSDGPSAVQSAYDQLSNSGGGTIKLSAGVFSLGGPVTPRDRVVLKGSGMGVSIFTFPTNVTPFLLAGPTSGIVAQYIAFEGFTVQGNWQGNQSQNLAERCFNIQGVTRLRWTDVECIYSRGFSISAQFCDEVMVVGCRVKCSARDGINITSCNRRIICYNVISNCDDDAIACHETNQGGNPPVEGDVIIGNTIDDSYGIKCLGISKGVIANNTIRRPKGYGIFTLIDTLEGQNDSIAMSITGNTITDIINSTFFGAGLTCTAIYCGNASKSWTEPVVGGSPPVITLPENLYYLSNTQTAKNAGSQGYNVSGNTVIGATLPAGNYSAWGFGLAFTKNGFVDVNLSTGFKFTQTGVLFDGPFLNAHVSNNNISCVSTPIALAANSATKMKSLDIKNNTLTRYSDHGVNLEFSTVRFGKVAITGNTFDGDPYFESTNRVQPLNGTWNASFQRPTAFDAVNFKGIRHAGNTYRNLNQVGHTNGNSLVESQGNSYILLPDSTANVSASNNNNKGLRRCDGMQDPSARIVWEDSDPTSVTYGQELFRQDALASPSIPTTGYYVTGQIVSNSGIILNTQTIGSATPEYMLVGWKRMTTGNTHVLNTDWKELHAFTGL